VPWRTPVATWPTRPWRVAWRTCRRGQKPSGASQQPRLGPRIGAGRRNASAPEEHQRPSGRRARSAQRGWLQRPLRYRVRLYV
jgi:hypothetical protein